MQSFILKAKKRLYQVDQEFLAKAPLIPNRYLWENQNFQIALHRYDGDQMVLSSDHPGFFKQYLAYYRERFEVEEFSGRVADKELIYGRLDAGPDAAEEEAAD